MSGEPESFGGLSRSWALSLRARNRSGATIYSYLLSARKLEDFLLKSGRPSDVAKIRRKDVEAFIADQLATGKPNTAGVRYRSLKQLFRWLVEEGEIDQDPMKGMVHPAAPEPPVTVVGDGDLAKLLAVCTGRTFRDRRDLAILRLFVATPCRLAEITGLAVEDVDLTACLLRVTGKGSRVRYAPFGAPAALAVDRYLRVRSRHRFAMLPNLWLGREGPMTTSGVTFVVKRRARMAGLSGIHPHAFRHTAAHRWKRAGGSEEDLMRLGGWLTPEVMQKYGRSLADERARDAYRKLNLTDRL